MATILVRKLDTSTWDPLYGNGQANFIADIDAVAQIIATTIKLFEGEWWENLNIGTPMFQSILGAPGVGRQPQAASMILQQRILSVPYVISLANVVTSYTNRTFSFACTAQTQFGNVNVALGPGVYAAPQNS